MVLCFSRGWRVFLIFFLPCKHCRAFFKFILLGRKNGHLLRRRELILFMCGCVCELLDYIEIRVRLWNFSNVNSAGRNYLYPIFPFGQFFGGWFDGQEMEFGETWVKKMDYTLNGSSWIMFNSFLIVLDILCFDEKSNRTIL